MVFNPEVESALKEAKIDRSQGLLCLLAFHFGLEADTMIGEEVLKKINMTHIVDRDYNTHQIKWNMPLFEGTEAGAFDWVRDWMKPFGDIGGPARRGVFKEVMGRMKEFFTKNPEFRKEDVYAARDLYFRTTQPKAEFVKTPHKFIYEGIGGAKTSMLLMWCERVKERKVGPNGANPFLKGNIVR